MQIALLYAIVHNISVRNCCSAVKVYLVSKCLKGFQALFVSSASLHTEAHKGTMGEVLSSLLVQFIISGILRSKSAQRITSLGAFLYRSEPKGSPNLYSGEPYG